MKRPMTPHLSQYYELAKKAHLPCPLGRAAYLTNRHMNTGLCRDYRGHRVTMADALPRLKAVQPATAARWERHWLGGGSLKALKYTHVQWLAMRRQRDRENRDHLDAIVANNLEFYRGLVHDPGIKSYSQGIKAAIRRLGLKAALRRLEKDK